MKYPAFTMEPVVQRRAGERGGDGDLHFIQPAFLCELPDDVKALWAGAVQAEHETSVHGNPVTLYPVDCVPIVVEFAGFPVRPFLEPVETGQGGTFKSNEDLDASAGLQQPQQFLVIRQGDIGLCKPAHVLISEGTQQLFGVTFIDE